MTEQLVALQDLIATCERHNWPWRHDQKAALEAAKQALARAKVREHNNNYLKVGDLHGQIKP